MVAQECTVNEFKCTYIPNLYCASKCYVCADGERGGAGCGCVVVKRLHWLWW